MPSHTRTCTNCGHTRPHDSDGFYRTPARNGRRARWDSQCKQCRRAYARRKYTAGAWIDALPTRALVNMLLERYWTLEGLAREVGCTPATLRCVRDGQGRVREVTARRVRRIVDEMATARGIE